MIYAVIDTNVIVSAFMTKHRDSATFKVVSYLVSGKIIPLYNSQIIAEYREVLSRDKFHITLSEINRTLGYFHTYGKSIEGTRYTGSMPDETDRVFYEVSLSKDDSFLVTGNLKHFPVSPKIVSPAEFLKITGLE